MYIYIYVIPIKTYASKDFERKDMYYEPYIRKLYKAIKLKKESAQYIISQIHSIAK